MTIKFISWEIFYVVYYSFMLFLYKCSEYLTLAGHHWSHSPTLGGIVFVLALYCLILYTELSFVVYHSVYWVLYLYICCTAASKKLIVPFWGHMTIKHL